MLSNALFLSRSNKCFFVIVTPLSFLHNDRQIGLPMGPKSGLALKRPVAAIGPDTFQLHNH
jgi:hypothetical protein